MLSESTSRIYGLDILRILSMLGIIGLHIFNAGGIISGAVGASNILITRMLCVICFCSVNIFAMLSGYFYVAKKKISSKSIFNLMFIVLLYCTIITAVFFIIRRDIFTNDSFMIVKAIFPPIDGKYWYITSYVLMFFLIPYMNIFISGIDKNTYRKLLVLLFVFLSVISTFGLKDYFEIQQGYSPFWLMFCYLIGAYIRIHGYIFNIGTTKKLIVFFINAAIVSIISIALKLVFKQSIGILYSYISPVTVVNAILMLEVFSNITLKNNVCQRICLSLSGAAFGVYIIHCHTLILDCFITGNLSFLGKLNIFACIICSICLMIGIYIVCWIIEIIRQKIFDILRVSKFFSFIGNKVDSLLGWN